MSDEFANGEQELNPESMQTIAELAYAHTLRVMAAVHHNKSRAARILGIDRRTLYRHLERGRKQQKEQQT